MAAKIKEFAKEHKLSQSISARPHPYQRLSTSFYSSENFKMLPGAGRTLEVTPTISTSQATVVTNNLVIKPLIVGYVSTCESPTSIRVQEKERGQESGVVGHNGNVHVMCLTFKTIQNDTAQYINK